jgi:hypothetical protein
MGRKCGVCLLSSRKEVDKLLINNERLSDISRKYGVAEHSLAYHRDHHLSRQLLKATELKENSNALDVLLELENLLSRTKRILDKAEARDKNQLALSAIKELRSCYELISKITFAMHEARLSELEMERVRAGEPDEEKSQLLNQMLDSITSEEYELFCKLNLKMMQSVHNPGSSKSGDTNQDDVIDPDSDEFGDTTGYEEIESKPLTRTRNDRKMVRTKNPNRDRTSI